MRQGRDVAEAIRYLRGERTQVELAQRAGLDPGTWSLYEKGRRRPSEENLDRIRHALRCSELEFEETVWHLRRARLLAETSELAQQEGLGEDSSRKVPVLADPMRREVRTLLQRHSAILEDLILLLAGRRE